MKKIVFLVGESGCGKSTLQERLIRKHPDVYTQIVSTTSRTPREGEVNGKDYHFVSEEDFQKLDSNDDLLQGVCFGGNYYGTQMSEYSKPQEIGLFVCTPEGVMDTINALREKGIVLSYEIIFFNTTDALLVKHGIDEERANRGKIRLGFMGRYYSNEFDNIPINIVVDDMVNEVLADKAHQWCMMTL